MEVIKTCSKCGNCKIIKEFKIPGCICKQCVNKNLREWRAINKDKQQIYYKRYQLRIKKWRKENKERVKINNKKYSEKKKRNVEEHVSYILMSLKKL